MLYNYMMSHFRTIKAFIECTFCIFSFKILSTFLQRYNSGCKFKLFAINGALYYAYFINVNIKHELVLGGSFMCKYQMLECF